MSDEAERLYERARLLPPEDRAAFVDDACRSDPQLRERLVSLLARAEAAEAFFERLRGAVFSTSSGGDGAGGVTGGVSDPDAHEHVPTSDPLVGRMVGHYRILSRIGSGGMGTVYRAHDTRLARDVALKFLPVHLTAAQDAEERLLAEARAAAALEHPNVCVVHEIGETDDGRPFIAMALYEGESLKQRLRQGPLPLDDAVAVAVQIARGLRAAHARGIVHRDVKPGNVMLTPDGTVKLLDFGLARVADVSLTSPGTTRGTVAYMSPEQARGDPLDQRADLWSLGVVLHEMLTGARPFRGGSDRALLQAILHDEAEPVSTRRPETPEPLTRVVARLLRKEPAERYGSADELLSALALALRPGDRAHRLPPFARHRPALLAGIGVALVALAALAGTAMWQGTDVDAVPSSATPAAVERVLVADFANFTSDSLLADAVSHALRIDLARSPGLRVAGAPAIAAALRRMRREPTARLSSELARELAVRERIRGVIDGEVREAGGGYVISASVVEAATGEVVDGWRETARDRAGVIPAIDRLSEAVRSRVGARVASLQAAEPLWRSTTPSLEALRKQAQASRAFEQGDFLRAAALDEEAIRLDSTFAHAHYGLAFSLVNAGARRRRALEAMVRAYELRDRLTPTERHAVTASYYTLVLGDLPKAIEAYRDQLQAAKAGGDFFLYAALGRTLVMAGDLPGAEAVLREAPNVWPTALSQGNLVEVLHRRGKLEDAAAVLQDGLARYPAHPRLMTLRAELSAVSGDHVAADSLAGELPASAGLGSAHRLRALNAAVQGRIEDATSHLAAMRRELLAAGRIAAAAEVTIAIGRLHLVRGEPEAARAEVERFLADQPLDSLDVLDRPHFALARLFALAGRPARARNILAVYDAEAPPEFREPDRRSYLRTLAAIHLAEGKPRDALAALERASRAPPIGERLPFDDELIPLAERPELARAYDRAGEADSAIATYERYAAIHSIGRTRLDAFELPDALFRLAELYEARGDRAAAARHYLRFAELWKDADTRLQPRVRDARRRAADLTRREAQKR